MSTELTYNKRMNLQEGIIEYKFDQYDTVKMMVFADLHVGNRLFNEDLFLKYLKTAKEENCLVLLNGDMVECGTISSHGTFDQNMDQNEQIDYIVDAFKPIADEGRIIGMIRGNHEDRVRKIANSLDINKVMADKMGVPDLKTAAFIRLALKDPDNYRKRYVYQVYATHGKSGSYKPGGKLNAVLSMREVANADVYIMSHLHSPMHYKGLAYDTHGMERLEKVKQYVITGAFLSHWGSYAHDKNAPPSIASVPKITFHSKFFRASVRM